MALRKLWLEYRQPVQAPVEKRPVDPRAHVPEGLRNVIPFRRPLLPGEAEQQWALAKQRYATDPVYRDQLDARKNRLNATAQVGQIIQGEELKHHG